MQAIEISLSQNLKALIDEEDYPLVSKYIWHAYKSKNTWGAATHPSRNKSISLHRLIMSCPKGMCVDHINGNGLDNRRENLRICTIAENNRNRVRMQKNNISGFRGVFWEKSCKKWRSQISINNKNVHLGIFKNIEDAYNKYCEASKRYYGEFSPIGGVS